MSRFDTFFSFLFDEKKKLRSIILNVYNLKLKIRFSHAQLAASVFVTRDSIARDCARQQEARGYQAHYERTQNHAHYHSRLVLWVVSIYKWILRFRVNAR